MVEGFYPKTVIEAAALLKEKDDCMLICGGTDVMVVHKKADNVIFLNGIDELKKIREEDGILRIGAACTYVQMLQNEKIPEILKSAISQIAAPAVRSAGTMAGNICNASPAGDTLPVLYALDAKVVVASLEIDKTLRTVRIPIQEFILGIRKIALSANELVTGIEIETENYRKATSIYYQKVGARKSEVIAKLSFAALAEVRENVVQNIRMAFGSVGITVIRRADLEKELTGLTLEQLKAKSSEIVLQYAKYINPISDQRSTAEYRKKVCLNLIRDFLGHVK